MNKTTEALKMAIETLENIDGGRLQYFLDEAIQACKEALEQPAQMYQQMPDGTLKALDIFEPAQEPFDVARVQEDGYVEWREGYEDLPVGTKLYTHPAPSWQGLSDDERHEVIVKHVSIDCTCDPYEFARAIEAHHGIGVKDGK